MSLTDVLDGSSVNCVRNLVPVYVLRCECASCRALRGEQAHELQAAAVADRARAAWRDANVPGMRRGV